MPDRMQLFTVTDLKQYAYCPRIFYYHACLPDIRPTTRKMQAGIKSHDVERKRAARRDMSMYGDLDGQRHFDLHVQSVTLRLSGIIDEAVEYANEWIPVDYKLARKSGEHYKLQLTAYGLMLEETTGKPVRNGYLYLIPARRTVKVPIGSRLRKKVNTILADMWNIATLETMPPATDWRQRCADCEFRRFCNDV